MKFTLIIDPKHILSDRIYLIGVLDLLREQMIEFTNQSGTIVDSSDNEVASWAIDEEFELSIGRNDNCDMNLEFVTNKISFKK